MESDKINWLKEAFLYELPGDRIAQRPIEPPDAARLLVCSRMGAGQISDSDFSSLPDFLKSGDLLVFNDTKVIPARLFGNLKTGAAVEILLLEKIGETAERWIASGKPLKKLKPGTQVHFGAELFLETAAQRSAREIEVIFKADSGRGIKELLNEVGTMPIPPYIRKGRGDSRDRSDYQTIFSKTEGSVAAPTASLHFTDGLISKLRASGVGIDFATLHVGSPSFLAVIEESEEGERLLSAPGFETYFYNAQLLDRIAETRRAGGRVFAVGTTVVRALESMARAAPSAEPLKTDIFIHPGFEFRAVDGIITNFHLPGSSHLLLVEAFLGRARLSEAYEHALRSGFRFLSYGDGMIILP